MNWKLIFGLSMFGLAMAIATVYIIPSNVESILWPIILLICAWIISRNAPGKYFLHGFLVCLLNCVWITSTHIILQTTYIANHAQEAEQYKKMMPNMTITQGMLATGLVIGIGTGLVLGLLSFIASKIGKKKAIS